MSLDHPNIVPQHPGEAGLILRFRPWMWARTALYEYFCMSWAARMAAEATRHAPLAARLVGESFELAIKAFGIVVQGPNGKLKYGHSLRAALTNMGAAESLLRQLWGDDLDYLVSIMDEECSPSQVRYGAGAGRPTKQAQVLPSGYAEQPDVWTASTLTMYEELMSSLGHAIWSNYPEGDRHGNAIKHQIRLYLAVGDPDNPGTMSREEESDLEATTSLDPTWWGLVLKASSGDSRKIPYWGIIPLDRFQDAVGTKFFVRARVSQTMVVDVEVTKRASGIEVGRIRIAGQSDSQLRLKIYSALAVMPDRNLSR